MLSRIWRLAKLFLRSPARAADACRDDENLAPGFWIYAAFTLLMMLFFALKPFDFPDANAPYPRGAQGLMFWFKVMMWQPPLEAAWMALLLGLVVWFRQGSLPVRLAAGVAWTAVPFVLMAVYAAVGADASRAVAELAKGAAGAARADAEARVVAGARAVTMAKWALGLGTAAWIGLFVPLWRRLTRREVMPVVGFMLGVNAIGVAMLTPMALATAWRSSNFFMAAQVAAGFWLLGALTLGLREATGLRLPRAFMAVLLSMFLQIAVAFTLHLLGLVPKDILKALLYA
ncbi:MAG: hypothetical protein PHU21_08875 [Elusimicrobia bacterium]|nr:hypothetical protein [Elusimicrobiota bacterium]